MKNALMILIAWLVTILFAASSFAAEINGIDIHGFISLGYLASGENDFTVDAEDDTFTYTEIGLNFGKELVDSLRIGVQLFAKDFADVSENKIMIDWAYADYRLHEMLGFRFGQIKFPHGLYNEARDIDMLRNPVFLPDSIYNEISYDIYSNDVLLSQQGIDSRDIYLSLQGIGLYGYIDLSMIGGLTYQAMYGTQKIEPNNSVSERQLKYMATQTPYVDLTGTPIQNDSVEVDFKYAASLLWDTPLEGFHIGASFNNQKMTSSSRYTRPIEILIGDDPFPAFQEGDTIIVDYDKSENLVFSVEYIYENLILTAEYLQATKKYEIESSAFERFGIGNSIADDTSKGWYVGGAYRFTNWLELGAYYSKSKYNEDSSDSNFSVYFYSEFDDICATARFDINEYWVIKLEAHNFRSVYPIYEFGPDFSSSADDQSEDIEDEWHMVTVKTTISF